jgi:hypothetical protein
MDEGSYKKMFLVGAIWNVAGGAVIVWLTGWVFASAHLSPPEPWVYYYSWIALFVTFGIGYFLVYLDMYGNKNLIILGIIGKLGFSVIFLAGMVSEPGTIPLFFLIPVIGDLVFVGLFGRFLIFARKQGK